MSLRRLIAFGFVLCGVIGIIFFFVAASTHPVPAPTPAPKLTKEEENKKAVGESLKAQQSWRDYAAKHPVTENAKNDPPKPAVSDYEREYAARAAVALAVVKDIQNSMRNPESFKIDKVISMADGSACYGYRAQNGFGGMNYGHAVMTAQHQIWTNEMDGFSSQWRRYCQNKSGDDLSARAKFKWF